MARPLISLFSYRTYALSARWCLSLTLVWSILWPVTEFEFNSPLYAETGPAVPANNPTLKQAKRLLDAGQAEEATTTLRRFLATSPKPDLLDDTYLLLGAALYSTKQYGDALNYLRLLQTEFPNSEVTDRGKLMQARVHAAMGNLDLALPILTGLRNLSKDDNTKREALRLSGSFYAQKKDATRAIQAWLDEVALGTEDQAEDVRARIRELASETSDKKTLNQIRDTFPHSFPGDLASLRLIDLYIGRGEEYQAIRQIQQFLVNFPTHPQAAKTSELLATLQTKQKSNQFFIAGVLPLSGKLAPFAGEVLSGIQLAVEMNRDRTGGPSIGLIVKDLESDYASFLDDFSDLLNTDRPLAVIGPLLSKNLPVMAELAERAHIPLITPAATLPNVRRLGNYVFSTALTYELQAKRIAAYAIKEQGFRRFCILHPDTAYGRELARLFAQEVRQHEGEVIAIESYKEGEADVGAQLKRMKAEDLKRYGLSVPVDQTKLTGKLTKLDKKVFYTPGFDAIFIPGRAADAGIITSQLNFHDMKVPFLGANGWNSPDFARTDDSSIDGAVFVDGFFVDSPTPTVQDFVARYKKRFETNPTIFAMQGYDAAKLVLDAVRKGASSGEAVRDQLLTQPDLSSLAGPAAFGPDGTLSRPLFLIQIKRGRFLQVN
jgi:ABC-type branched-subunit amino acid transport system substrate-binding protein/outer membrane protein assembly factor BamD (BamD/ComL family)